ncbi:ccr4 associated factor [Knufia obscura]|uniref:Iron-sulfur cluster assembly factor IBA57 homolog, mitochondrial n=2 Tax=Knufia TaxID=430999 RepID=A0AAN8EQQ8_9EURO|nr:ccr4 associated factor [Knufia obscura]KAK5951961.1 ccr4 associated factor [Knufia fluminis]
MASNLASRPVASSICWRCETRGEIRVRSLHSSPPWELRSPKKSSTNRRQYSTDAPKLNHVVLSGRTLISFDGPDAADFLHNLIPAPVLPLEETSSCIATAFLNAKGRILHDAFVHKPSKENAQQWYLEVGTNSASAIMKHLKKHKLRSKFKLQQLSPDEAAVFYLWPRSSEPADMKDTELHQDPRPKMGRRGYYVGENATQNLRKRFAATNSREEYHWEDYQIHRMLNGHAEGPVEIASEHALPQESNLDFYGGIDFHKGCYLGQELTIRTHHTGVVRKRILPVQLYTDENLIPNDQTRPLYDPTAALPQPPNEANIAKCGAKGRSGRSTGRWLGGYGNIGLALCRLETMTDLSLTAEGSAYDAVNDEFEVSWQEGETSETKNVKVKAFVPPWLRQAIEGSIKARSERSQARRRKDSDEDEEDLD